MKSITNKIKNKNSFSFPLIFFLTDYTYFSFLPILIPLKTNCLTTTLLLQDVTVLHTRLQYSFWSAVDPTWQRHSAISCFFCSLKFKPKKKKNNTNKLKKGGTQQISVSFTFPKKKIKKRKVKKKEGKTKDVIIVARFETPKKNNKNYKKTKNKKK